MKELSIEEKAKAYNELFVKAKQIYNKENDVLIIHTIEDLFPELAEPDDEKIRKMLIEFFGKGAECNGSTNGIYDKDILAWLEKLGEKIDAIENFDTEFEKQVSRLLASAINKEHEYNQGYVKWAANALLNYAKHELEKQGEQNHDWSKEDESRITTICTYLQDYARLSGSESRTIRINEYCDWLKSLKDKVQPQPQPQWSKEDERNIQTVDSVLFYDKNLPEDTCMRLRNWLKSIRHQNVWNPSKEQMLAISTAINVLGKGTLNGKQLIELQEQLKKLRGE